MTQQPADLPVTFGRRRLFRDGAIVVSFGALVAACGTDRDGATEPGRVGVAEPPATLPEVEVNDVVLLRTAQSLEYTALAVYDTAAGLGVLEGDALTLVERFVEDHTGHAAALGELITANGGEEFQCPNPFLMERAITPIVEAISGSDDVLRDVLNTAHALETLAARTYQAVVGSLTTAELRQAAMAIGVDENRHAAALAIAITGAPEAYVGPELTGEDAAPSEEGVLVPHAITDTFGQLGGIRLIIGARNDEGARSEFILQTPAGNSFVYDYLSC
jgi:Ferritin-like domain